MRVVDPGHVYVLADEQSLHFIKRTDGELVHDGTTNEELLEVLIDRTEGLNAKLHCKENDMALSHLRSALKWFEKRTQRRVEQGVETTDQPHESSDVAGEFAGVVLESGVRMGGNTADAPQDAAAAADQLFALIHKGMEQGEGADEAES